MSTSSDPSSLGGREKAVTFIVPALNEGARVGATVREIEQAAAGLEGFEILLVDDGSDDDTPSLMEALAHDTEHIRVLRHPVNRGLGAAYKSGLAMARLPYVMLVPGDNCFPATSIAPILARVGEADMVIPYHLNAATARPLKRRLLSDVYTGVANRLSGFSVPYYNGIVIHRTDLVRAADIRTDGFAYQLEGLIKLLRRGHSFITVGIELVERQAGRSTALRWRNLLQIGEVFARLATDALWF
ncbi:Glycosyltransferase family 2 protein [Gammaproteobacteria bacterium]